MVYASLLNGVPACHKKVKSLFDSRMIPVCTHDGKAISQGEVEHAPEHGCRRRQTVCFRHWRFRRSTDSYINPVAWDVHLSVASHLPHGIFCEIGLPQGSSRLREKLAPGRFGSGDEGSPSEFQIETAVFLPFLL